MVYVTYALVLIALFGAAWWMSRPHNPKRCRECQAIAARLPQRETPYGLQVLTDAKRDRWFNEPPTENSASKTSSESEAPSTLMPYFSSLGLTDSKWIGVSLPQSPSGKAAQADIPAERTLGGSGHVAPSTDTKRGKRESRQ